MGLGEAQERVWGFFPNSQNRRAEVPLTAGQGGGGLRNGGALQRAAAPMLASNWNAIIMICILRFYIIFMNSIST